MSPRTPAGQWCGRTYVTVVTSLGWFGRGGGRPSSGAPTSAVTVPILAGSRSGSVPNAAGTVAEVAAVLAADWHTVNHAVIAGVVDRDRAIDRPAEC